ncbi:MAG: ABC transporter ATP-binding protein [Bacteroidales bacterium]|nr:ABC transporter ATP-binding protein [Bacteroidales bacterium]
MEMLKRLLRYLLNYKSNIFLVVLAQLLYAVFSIFTLSMIVPFLSVLFGQVDQVTVRPEFSLTTRYVIDTFYYYMGVVITRYGQMSALFYIAGVMILLSFLSNLCRYMGMFWLAPIRSGILQDLRHDLYERILILPLSFYSEQRKGDIISRMGADVLEVEWSVFSSLQSMCRDPFLIIIFVATLFAINVPLTLITLVILPLMGYGLAAIGRGIKKYSLKSQQLLGRMSSLFEEAVGGLRVVKGYNAEKQAYEKFKHENFQFYRLNKRVFRINELGAPLVEFLCILALLLISLTALVWLPSSATMKGTVFMLYFVVFARVIPPAKALVSTYYTLQKGMTAASRVYEIIDADEKITECQEPKTIDALKDSIEYRNVSFAYGEGQEQHGVLHHIDLTIRRGQTIAVVGPSGSGKSTLVDLLPRFYDITEGELLLDGIPVNQYRISDLRSLFGIVNQDVILFNDTVYNNIVFGMKDVTEEQVVAAAKIAQAHQFISEMEDGYQTVIGDRGARLSGGQRQRISIARAILRNPEVLILDEATSALDNESEYSFQEALMPLVKTKTAIIIAHRLSTIRFADEIIFLKEGRIVERGSHDKLMAARGEYYHFYTAQSES